ncbi:MAG: hypothetical protein AAGA77_17550 [Bacteroidota bacterium]
MANIVRDIANAPLPEMVKTLGIGIAKAQRALDLVSMDMAKQLAVPSVSIVEGGPKYSLLALGFTPTFYQFTDTVLEVKLSFSMSKEREFGASISASGGFNVGFVAMSASVTASYSQKYQYSAEGSSMLRTRLVTVPNPPAFERRLQALVDTELEKLRQGEEK